MRLNQPETLLMRNGFLGEQVVLSAGDTTPRKIQGSENLDLFRPYTIFHNGGY